MLSNIKDYFKIMIAIFNITVKITTDKIDIFKMQFLF